jgi:hypothetical protein
VHTLMETNWHLIWLWGWFFVGAFMYWLKRAYYGINPPNPVANNYRHYIQRAWVPLLVRFFLDSLVFWMLFIPGMADKILLSLGWSSLSSAVDMVTKYGVFAAVFGHTVDSIIDLSVTKIPWIKDVLPQMPGPMAANVNITDQKLVEAKKNVEAAADNLAAVPPNPPGGDK